MIKRYVEFITELKQQEVHSMFNDFIRKYDISSFDEFVYVMTFCIRDLNKYVKKNRENKKRHYQIKDWYLKFLYKNGYIREVKKHRINNQWFLLFWTKIENPESFGGYISFHATPKSAIKLGIDVHSLEEENNEYQKRDVDYIDVDKMNDAKELVEYLLVPEHLSYLKKMLSMSMVPMMV